MNTKYRRMLWIILVFYCINILIVMMEYYIFFARIEYCHIYTSWTDLIVFLSSLLLKIV